MKYQGTPVDLRQAIQRGLQEILAEQEITRDHKHVKRLHDIIQDRLSQNFSTAMCKTTDSTSMMNLWYAIFPRKARH